MFSSIFNFNFRVFFTIIYQNLRHFSFRRLAFTLGMVVLFAFLVPLIILLRLLDEVFFPFYHRKKVKDPVFIISTPRSGTTLLHRLMAADEERFTYFLLYHNLIPSVLFYKFILALKWLDRKLGGTMKRFWNRIEKAAFGGWKGIHNMGFEKSEEDEGLFALTMNSPSCGMITPWMGKFSYLTIADKCSPRWRKAFMNYYTSTLQRFLFAWGRGKRLLVKNVMSVGRIRMILERMPEARVIMILRHPYQTIPSITSMFGKTWSVVSPDIPENSPHYRAWGALNIEYYKYMKEVRPLIPEEQLLFIQYDDLVNDPLASVLHIYDHFGWEVTDTYRARLQDEVSVSKKYEVGHRYTLGQYGYSKERIDAELNEVYEAFGFHQQLAEAVTPS